MKEFYYFQIRLFALFGLGCSVSAVIEGKFIVPALLFSAVGIIGYLIMDFFNKEEALKTKLEILTENVFKPHPEDLHNACMYFRHDYGLMKPEEQENLRWQAKEWLYAWSKAKRYN